MTICLENLQEFAVVIFHGSYVFASKYIFIYVSKSCLYGSKPLLYVSRTFLIVRFSLLTVFLYVIVMAVMGHLIIRIIRKHKLILMHLINPSNCLTETYLKPSQHLK